MKVVLRYSIVFAHLASQFNTVIIDLELLKLMSLFNILEGTRTYLLVTSQTLTTILIEYN